MNRPTPNSDELPSTVRPKTLDIEPSANTPAARSPATPNHLGSSRVRSPARETAAVSAVMVHTIGIRPCKWFSARTADWSPASATPTSAVSAAWEMNPTATNVAPLTVRAVARVSPARLPDQGCEGGDEHDHRQQRQADRGLAGQQRRSVPNVER